MLCASALVVSKMRWYTSLCVVGIFLLFLRDGVLLTMSTLLTMLLYLLCYYHATVRFYCSSCATACYLLCYYTYYATILTMLLYLLCYYHATIRFYCSSHGAPRPTMLQHDPS